MEKLIAKCKKQTNEKFGQIIIDGKCVFCGSAVNDGYCNCPEAELINRYFKRASSKICDIKDYGMFESDIEAVRKKYILPFVKIPRKFQGMKFEHYITENDSQKKALNGIVEFYENGFKNYLTGMNLILFGNYGTGKTMLMSILCRELANEYLFKCKFVNVVDFMNEIKDSFNESNNKTVKQILDVYNKSDFLFLDDIDKIKPTEYAKETIYSIVNTRTENELSTIISANHSPEELDSFYFNEAIISRLADVNNSKIIQFSHQNKRLGG